MIETIFQKIGSAVLTGAITIASLFGVQAPSENLGAAIPIVVSTFQTSLQTSITSSATSMTLVNGTDSAGNTLSGYVCFNLDEGTALEEFVCGTAAGTAVTSMIRGIDPIDGDLEVASLKKAHRRGASAKITDYPSLAIVSRILAGTETIPAPISYASGIGPIGSSDIADKEYVLSVVSGGSVTFEKVIEAGIAGETVAAGNLVYYKTSDSRWWKTDADTAATVENVVLGIAQGAGTAGNAITGGVLKQGIDSNQSGLSANTVYYASNTAGGVSSSAGTKEVTVGFAPSTTTLAFNPRFNQRITEDEQDALAGGSTFGTPSSTNKFITQDYNSSATGLPVVRTYTSVSSAIGGSTTQFDITNPAGTTFRYTWDATGTDPTIDCTANPIGSLVNLQAQNFTAANNGVFKLTGCGSTYFEVTNASGVAENNKTIGTGYVVESGSTAWTKPTGLKFIVAETQAAGGGGFGANSANGNGGGGGGGGGYSRELIQASSLSSSEYYIIGAGAAEVDGRMSAFGSFLYANPGIASAGNAGGVAGVGVGGDVNLEGTDGQNWVRGDADSGLGGLGGNSFLGGGGRGAHSDADQSGANGNLYGGGGGGTADTDSAGRTGGAGAQGIVIITEYFN